MARISKIIGPIFALFIGSAIAALILTIDLKSLYLTNWGDYSTTQRTLYITGVTVLATLVAGFISQQVQALLLSRIDRALQRYNQNSEIKDALNHRWRTILSMSGLLENFHNLQIWGAYIIIGLITTSIVSSFTPSPTNRLLGFNTTIPNGQSTIFGNAKSPCTLIVPLSKVQNSPDRFVYWDLKNGSAYWVQSNLGGCPTRDALSLLGMINTQHPDLFAYVDGGVAVHRTAIGVPIRTYSYDSHLAPELAKLLETYGSDVINTTQCVRVMKKNPVICRPGGKVLIDQSWTNVTSADGGCYSHQRLYPLTHSTLAKDLCSYGQVGQAVIVFAATGQYAYWFGTSLNVNISTLPPTNDLHSVYTATCMVDARDVFEYREVTFSFKPSYAPNSTFSRILTGGPSCQPPDGDTTIHQDILGTAIAAYFQLLSENDGMDGWFETTWHAINPATAKNGRGPPFAFEQSINALEDVFGLISALVTARIASPTLKKINGTATVAVLRIGTGEPFALLYLLPPVFAAIVLLFLIWGSFPWCTEDTSSHLTKLIEFGSGMSGNSVGKQREIEGS